MTEIKAWFQDTWRHAKKSLHLASKANPEKLDLVDVGLPNHGHVIAFGHLSSERKYADEVPGYANSVFWILLAWICSFWTRPRPF